MDLELEHVLAHLTINTNIVNKLIQTISPSDIDYRSKISIILRTLEDQLRKASIHEWMLELLEVLEQLFLLHSKPTTTLFQDAYCAIAVESTLKYLHVTTSLPYYLQAVETIWYGRVHHMEMSWQSYLFSDELENWKTQIRNSLLDPRIMKNLACIPNTRRNALQKLELFFAQASDNLGPPQNLDVIVNDSHVIATVIKGKSINTVDAEGMDETASCSKINSMPVDEVPKTGESLQCSSAELETQEVEDMNREAQLENDSSDTVDTERMDATTSYCKINSMPMDEVPEIGESLQCSSAVLENQEIEDVNQEGQLESNSPDAYVPILQACQSINNNKANHKKTTSAHQSDVHRPSLMEPNCSARTHEWDDSIGLQGGTSDTSKISLPSPKLRKLPPFGDYKDKSIKKGRKHNPWSQLEVNNLRAGVKVFGHVWKNIFNSFTFEGRTPVDLKDKWRNMLRNGQAQE